MRSIHAIVALSAVAAVALGTAGPATAAPADRNIVEADGSNGIIHVINKVLIPG
jgi:uncharacterized surface protein with fasciclin (FAS1) repeats